MLPVAADFTKPFELPVAVDGMPRAGFFPGSTIGNFEPHEAAAFLRHAGRILGRGAMFIVGVDLVKDTQVLQKAYNDSQGVTAKFNLNLLARINRELGAKFDLGTLRASRLLQPRALAHRDASGEPEAPARPGRAARCIDFRAGETIHTENSYKYSVESFGALARGAGWTPVGGVDRPRQHFSVTRCDGAESPRRQSEAQRRALALCRVGLALDLAPQPARGLVRRGASSPPLARRLASRISVDVDGADQRPQRRERAPRRSAAGGDTSSIAS